MTLIAQSLADLLVESEAELLAEREANAALRDRAAKRDGELSAAAKRIATLEGQADELRKRAEAAEARPVAVAPAGAPNAKEIEAALAATERAIIAAMPKPVVYSGIDAQRDAAGMLRSWKFRRAE